MDDETNIRLINPHAEGDGGHHNQPIFCHEAVLRGAAIIAVFASVIGQGLKAGAVEGCGNVVNVFARQAIDDAALPAFGVEQGQQIVFQLFFRQHGER